MSEIPGSKKLIDFLVISRTLPKNNYPTIGVEFATKAVPLKAGRIVKADGFYWEKSKVRN